MIDSTQNDKKPPISEIQVRQLSYWLYKCKDYFESEVRSK